MEHTIVTLIYLGILLVVLCSVFFVSNRPSVGQTMQIMVIWGMIFLGMIAIYGLWDDIRSNFSRDTTQIVTDRGIIIPRSYDNHFYVTLEINDTPVKFMIDTGASDLVLTQEDAAKVGINMDRLLFSGRAFTANGEVKIARTWLENVRLGDHTDRNVPASVNSGTMNGSLLGMSYLGRFPKLEITADQMILHR